MEHGLKPGAGGLDLKLVNVMRSGGGRRIARFFQLLPAEGWLTILALFIWMAIHSNYGITWDEPEQSDYGEAVRKYFFSRQSFSEFCHQGLPENAYYYGPALSLFCAVISHAFGADIFAVRHGVQGLLWVAMFYPACALGRRISGSTGAWCAGLALLGVPNLLGQAFNNPKDMPLACAALWLLHASVAAASVRRLNWRHALSLGGAAGFVLAMRPGAWFMCGLLALVPLAGGWRNQRRLGRVQIFRTLGETMPVLCAAAAIGWILMILPWPNAWHSPLLHPIKAATYAMHFDGIVTVLFRGNYYPSNQLPWDYLAGYLSLTLPVPLLVLGIWGHLVLWRKSVRSITTAMTALGIIFLAWIPLLGFIVTRPNVYDGMRHFLFVLPPLAIIAGIAAADLIQRLRAFPKWLVVPGVLALLLSAGPAMVRLHPYQNVYYNCLAGPRATLPGRYETDYWLSSYREAAEWINAVQSHSSRKLSVALAANGSCDILFTHFLDQKIKVTDIEFANLSDGSMPPGIDYYVATVRLHQSENFSAMPVAHRIERDGILLAIIRGNPRP
jgi:hypothetical protein